MEAWIRTDEAAAILNTTPSNLAQYSYRLEHVCLREDQVRPKPVDRPYWNPKKGPLLWPENVIREAAAVREAEADLGVGRAIERVAGKRAERRPWQTTG
jgi:hypothetical protein